MNQQVSYQSNKETTEKFESIKDYIVNQDSGVTNKFFEPIAIVGMSCKFPMAKDANEFWKNVREGKDCIIEIPKERWDWQEYCGDPISEVNKTNIKWGGFIDGVDEFDPLFFGISPKEADFMDPQQRLMITYVWKAIEDAGIIPKVLSQKPTGVFIAAGPGDYMNTYSTLQNNKLAMTNIFPSLIPNRISYVLNLHGPSEYYETACSSSLIALHRAIQSIHRHECEQAIVGAISLLLSPMRFIGYELMSYLSNEGQCNSFQTGANGFVLSEGVGAIIIKPLQKAIENDDLIYAVIKGTGVSHGGKEKSLTSPNAMGMKAAMIQAYQASEIDPRTVSYIEAHGVGSLLADSVEVTALKSGYQELATLYSQISQDEAPPCYISSLKPCIGQSEAASGMGALLKVISAIRDQFIPGVPRFTVLNENISLEGSPFRITAESHNWEKQTDINGKKLPRRASINSFGFGGVNAHMVLEEYIPPQEETEYVISVDQPQIIVFSAKNPDRLQDVVKQILTFVEIEKEPSLSDFAYTLQVGREAMESRLAMIVSNQEELILGMKEYLESIQENKDLVTSIPIYTGNLIDDKSELRSLISGKVEELILQMFLAEKNFEKIALFWTQGGNIPWEALHEGKKVHRISLPTYPFARERYWTSINREEYSQESSGQQSRGKKHKFPNLPKILTQEDIQDYIAKFLSQELNIAQDNIKSNVDFQNYGVDSIITTKFLRNINKRFNTKIKGREMLEYRTIKSLSAHLVLKIEELNNQKVALNAKLEIEPQHSDENIDDSEIEALEMFGQGILTLEEIESLIGSA